MAGFSPYNEDAILAFMFQIAIVDDDSKAIENLRGLLERYGKENSLSFAIEGYSSSAEFLRVFKKGLDLIFLDIQLGKDTGFDVAEKIRAVDQTVAIIFETEFGQYAIQGYKYNAVDYFVKPVAYYDLALRMQLVILEKKKANPLVVVKVRGGVKSLPADDILYIEEVGHTPVYHSDSEEFTAVKRMSLSHVEKELGNLGFARCNSSFLVNLSKCRELRRDEVVVGSACLPISRGMRQAFVTKLSQVLQLPGGKGEE